MHATHRDLVFEAFKDGSAGIRTHPTFGLTQTEARGRKGIFGEARNSEGLKGKGIWGETGRLGSLLRYH